jgi:hypothetical protein
MVATIDADANDAGIACGCVRLVKLSKADALDVIGPFHHTTLQMYG